MQPLDPLKLGLEGRKLIEASAGTGKTYTTGLLFLRLLLERDLAIDQILVVTFTRAATEELRGRIRLRIREALDLLDQKGTEDVLLQELMASIADRQRARMLLQDALTRMDEAAVFTIHGFCQRMLQEHAFESGAAFEMEFLETELLLRTTIIEDFWRKRFYPASAPEAAWARSCWQGPEALLADLGGQLNRPGVVCLPRIEDQELAYTLHEAEALFPQIRAMWQRSGNEIEEELQTNKRLLRSRDKGFHPDTIRRAVDAMAGFVQDESMPWLLPKELHFLTRTRITTCLGKKGNATPPEHPFFDLFDDFCSRHQAMTHCRKIAVLQSARDVLQTELSRRKQEQDQLYYDDLLTLLDRALDGADGRRLAWSIITRFPAVMVDEFQDTDPLQYRIFSRLQAVAPQAGLFLIGDPKQAIYGFRGADIFTYIQARRETGPENRFTMTTNYRSTTSMVKAVNRLFNRGNSFFLDHRAISFSPVGAKGHADDTPLLINDRQPPALTCLLLEEPPPGKTLAKKDAWQQAGQYCAHEIARLVAGGLHKQARIGERPLHGGDIAVLVRTHDEAEIMRTALAALGINSVSISRESVFAGPEAAQLVILLTALLNLSDAAMVRTALASDLFGYSAMDLEQLHSAEQQWEELMAELTRYQALWQQNGFLPMFQRLLSEQRLVSRLQAGGSGERSLTNYLHLAELLQAASREQPGPDGLLRWLNDQIRIPGEQSESRQLRLESDENLVKIVTIHKAKGLEFPVVFLPFLWSARKCRAGEPLTFHRPNEPDTLYLDLGSAEPDNLQLAENERLAGDLRLLYVAVTRARYSCSFCWGSIRNMDDSALCYLLHKGSLPDEKTRNSDLAELLGADNIRPYPATFSTPALQPEERGRELQAKEFRGHIDSSWQITSYSRLAAQSDRQPERPDYDQQEEKQPRVQSRDPFGFPRGAVAGTCLHGILERISFSDPSGHEQVVRSQLERAGLDDCWLEVAVPWLAAVLRTELEPGFSLSCLDNRDRVNEMAFYFPLESVRLDRFNEVLHNFGVPPLTGEQETLQGLMVGFVDLVYRFKGRYFVADYKSNHLGNTAADYGQPNLEVAIREHRYDLQYLIYTLALHRFLRQRIRGYSYDLHMGGIRYLFLRGMAPDNPPATGVFAARPEWELIKALDCCFEGGAC